MRDLRKAYQRFNGSRDPVTLLEAVGQLMAQYGTRAEAGPQTTATRLDRDDLRLVCFDVLSS